MLDSVTRKRIDNCRDILVGKLPSPSAQVEQITIALIYKFMDDMDRVTVEEYGGNPTFFKGDFEKYSWQNIYSPRTDAHQMLNLYAEGIQKMGQNPGLNPMFRSIFKDAFLPYRDPETLRLFLSTINEFSYEHSEMLGDAFEYLLSIMGSQGDAGQFRTPRHIIDFLVELVDPKIGETILDPACGTSGFLISAYKHILNSNKKDKPGDLLSSTQKKELLESINGYDISPDMVRLSSANLFLHGFTDDELNIHEYDTLSSEDRWNEYYDVIIANPPFMTPKGGIRPHNRFSVDSNRAEVLFTNYIMEHLTPKGRAGIVVPEGIIFQSGKAYKQLRKALVEKYLIGVISLPSGVFNPYSGVKTSILILDRELSQRTNKIFFSKVENDGFDLGAQRREIDKNDLPRIKERVLGYVNTLKEGIDKEHPNLTFVSKEEIINSNDIGLSFERYSQKTNRNSEFKTLKLESVLKFDNGYAFKSENYVSEGLRIIRIKNVQKGVVVDNDPKFYPTETLQEYKNFELLENDILISLTGNVGRVGIIKRNHLPALLNQRVCRVRIDDNIIDRNYLFRILNTNWFEDYCIANSSGSAQKNLSTKAIGELKIPIPPLEIQKEIVEELEQYQKIIDGAKQVVGNYKPHIDIDPSWGVLKLKEIADLIGGGTPSKKVKEFWDGDIGWLSCADFSDDPLLISMSNRKISKSGLLNSSSNLIKSGSIILVTRVSLGRVAQLDGDFAINQDLTAIEFNEEIILKEFGLLFLKTISDKIIAAGSGSTVKGVTREFVKNLEIAVPEILVQQSIIKKFQETNQIIEGNKKLIEIYTQKIEDRINKIWGE